MTAKITRLRIAGFKSFADAATIDILPGLTGIVGPNGCGKSNVVEALRWAMGESSARALRGGETDDLIFAGTGARAARSLAEVSLWLEQAAGLAPHPFNEAADLEIVRRAERGSGTEFRLNSKAIRARDITTLFADLSSGARSSSIISQNRVAALISAKPEDRRSLLEEAAGISGLHVRRHDAELKLRQTETNLSRVDDLRLQLDERVVSLGEQTEQARQYRKIAETLRADEVTLQALLHARAVLAVEQTRKALDAARAILEDAKAESETAARDEALCRARIAPARQAGEAARAQAEQLRIETETARVTETAALRALEAAQLRTEDGETALKAAVARIEEAEATQRDLIVEGDTLQERARLLPDACNAARTALTAAEQAFADARRALSEKESALLDQRIENDTRSRAREALAEQIATIQAEVIDLDARLATIAQDIDEGALNAITSELQNETNHRTGVREALDAAREAHDDARIAAELSASAAHSAEQTALQLSRAVEEHTTRLARLTSETTTLTHEKTTAGDAIVDAATLQAHERTAHNAAKLLETAAEQEETARQRARDADAARLEAASAATHRDNQGALARRESDATRSALERAQQVQVEAAKDLKQACQTIIAPAALQQAQDAANAAAENVAALTAEEARLEKRAANDQTDLDNGRRQFTGSEAELLRLTARREGLAAEEEEPAHGLPPILEAIDIPADLATAVSVAFEETLDAPASDDETIDASWRRLEADGHSAWPDGVTPLQDLLDPPAALARAFSGIGLVEKLTDGSRLHPQLSPGQILVSKEGAVWRWDGYRTAQGRPSRMAQKLARQRSVKELTARIADLEERLPLLASTVAAAERTAQEAVKALSDCRHQRLMAERERAQKRESAAALASRNEAASKALAAAQRTSAAAESSLDEAKHRADDAEKALAALPSVEAIHARREATHQQHLDAQAFLREASQHRLNAAHALETARETARRVLLRHQSAQERIATLDAALARLESERRTAETDLCTAQARSGELDLTALRAAAEARAHSRRECATVLEALTQRLAALDDALAQKTRLRETVARRHAEASAQRATLLPRLETQRTTLLDLQKRYAALPLPETINMIEAEVGAAGEAQEMTRLALDEARTKAALLNAEQTTLSATLPAIQARIEAGAQKLQTRRAEAQALRQRLADLYAERQQAEVEPERLRGEMARRAHDLTEAEARAEEAWQSLGKAENAVTEASERRERENARAQSAREDEIRLLERQAQFAAALETLEAAGSKPADRAPEDLSDAAETGLRRRIARLIRERDALGAVNLRAEQEYEEARSQSAELLREQTEIQEAINRLRGSIGRLNKEGRERLSAVFTQVDRHFQALFSRMFGGGRAHLGLIGSDDPLEAGLEIYAQPPGKKLSTLSLLSGGEQALTALSLVFATFKCQPAPICVLDEVDAPLDDANVERLCSLVRDMAAESETRFLIVTHHQVTMAHMDRLFGVTMQERGVSRVLSVDLARAAAFTQTG